MAQMMITQFDKNGDGALNAAELQVSAAGIHATYADADATTPRGHGTRYDWRARVRHALSNATGSIPRARRRWPRWVGRWSRTWRGRCWPWRPLTQQITVTSRRTTLFD